VTQQIICSMKRFFKKHLDVLALIYSVRLLTSLKH
jgi:hypothetical protein